MNARDQWPGLPNDYLSTSVSYDRWADELNSGFGIIGNGELSGTGQLWRAEIAPTYAYQAVINDKIVVRSGVKMGFNSIGINKNKLLFNDQLESGTVTTETKLRSSRTYLDFSWGLLGMYDNYWAGLSVNHLNQPDQSLLEGGSNPLPRRWSFHGGAKIPLNVIAAAETAQRDITLAFDYKAQGKFDQLDIGGYLNTYPVVLGIWYRGLPLKSNRQSSINADAITLLFGLYREGYRLGFSYDITVSRLAITRSAGSFEISFIKEWTHKKKKRRKQFIVPCAKF